MTVYDTEDWFAFVRAVRANPDDDAPRLCAADWLDDRGEAGRAELIRVQCEHARLTAAMSGGRVLLGRPLLDGSPAQYRRLDALQGRAVALLADRPWPDLRDRFPAAQHDLTTPIIVTRGGAAFVWRRGFVAEATMTAADWLAHADAILARHPVAAVTLTTGFGVLTYHRGPHRDACRLTTGLDSDRVPLAPLSSLSPGGRDIGSDDSPLIVVVAALLAHYWPGVRFTLPAPTGRRAEYDAAVRAWLATPARDPESSLPRG